MIGHTTAQAPPLPSRSQKVLSMDWAIRATTDASPHRYHLSIQTAPGERSVSRWMAHEDQVKTAKTFLGRIKP
jgi:hypothetical protein